VSLVDAARQARATKAKTASRVITDETLAIDRSAIPDLNLEHDNVADIVKAIGEYKSSHTAEETEHVVREWYNRYDHLMQRAADENAAIRSRQEDQRIQPREYTTDDYRQYREEMLEQARSQAQDQKLLRENGTMNGRIQSAFYKIKSDILAKYRLNYEWLKPSAQYW